MSDSKNNLTCETSSEILRHYLVSLDVLISVQRPLLSGFRGGDQVILTDPSDILRHYLVSLDVPISVQRPLLSGFRGGDQVILVMSDSKNNLTCDRLILVKFFDTISYLSTCLFQFNDHC
ncbi:hypothetical protein CDAR_411531 [Caerostris darwini]|uniref:Uncharacterized protein n=1 Tax=Caerostris darwini TaxID=1538125 RepID=A0AAV4SD54_9ARAC|nr:hypothetical protein CDAR_411531 [Caerostris darwini]